MDTRIYVMTHKKIANISDEIYIPLHVGREGKEDMGYLGDNLGENISHKNHYYCELTGVYWLWKNISCDVIGVCHYRRYFVKNGRLFGKSDIEQLISHYPIILPDSAYITEESIYQQFALFHNSKDLDICREVIEEKYPDYLAPFDFYMDTILFSIGNMWITRKDIFDRYCEWLFDILSEVEKRIDTTGYTEYQKRVMGFLAERLFRVWLFMQPEAIMEENIKVMDMEAYQNAKKIDELKYRRIKLTVAPVIELYKSGKVTGSLAQPLECKDDFDGKIPIWVCWWQGETQMPDLVRCCVESIKRNLPQEKAVLRLITLENCLEYVTFSETVIRKFNEQKITYVHLSDILRAELLYRYGGMWVDATYYAARPIPPDIFHKKIYTLKFAGSDWDAFITKGRWSGNLWYTGRHYKLFQFLMECFWYYWEIEDKLEDYFLIDDIIAIAVELFDDVRHDLMDCAYASDKVFSLQKQLNCKYTLKRAEEMEKGSVFYKLRYQETYQKENMAGEQTMFGYLIDQLADDQKDTA